MWEYIRNIPPAEYIVFYDSQGKRRAPEMCLRYITKIKTSTPKEVQDMKQTVAFLQGGLDSLFMSDILSDEKVLTRVLLDLKVGRLGLECICCDQWD